MNTTAVGGAGGGIDRHLPRNHHRQPLRHQYQTPLVLRRSGYVAEDSSNKHDVIMSQSMFAQQTMVTISPDEGVAVSSNAASSPYTSLSSSSGTGRSPPGGGGSNPLSSPSSNSSSSSVTGGGGGGSDLLRRSSIRAIRAASQHRRDVAPETDSGWQFCSGKDDGVRVVDMMTQSCIATPLLGGQRLSRKLLTVKPTQVQAETTDNNNNKPGQMLMNGAKNVRSRLMQILAVTPVVLRRTLRSSSVSVKSSGDKSEQSSMADISYQQNYGEMATVRRSVQSTTRKAADDEESWDLKPVRQTTAAPPSTSSSRTATMTTATSSSNNNSNPPIDTAGLLDRMHKAYYGAKQPPGQATPVVSRALKTTPLGRRLLRFVDEKASPDPNTRRPQPQRRHHHHHHRPTRISSSSSLSSPPSPSPTSNSSSSSSSDDETTSSWKMRGFLSKASAVIATSGGSTTTAMFNDGPMHQLLMRHHHHHHRHAGGQPLGDSTANKSDDATSSQSQIEAATALRWLKAAGFPQYYQMFIENEFPIDLETVERDHDFLDADLLQPLLKRLRLLNDFCTNASTAASSRRLQLSQRSLNDRPSSAANKQNKPGSASTNTSETMTEFDDDGDEDDVETDCALSDRWKYQLSLGRWARRDSGSNGGGAGGGGKVETLVDSASCSRARRNVPATSPHHMASPLQRSKPSTDDTRSLVVLAQFAANSVRGLSLASLPQFPAVVQPDQIDVNDPSPSPDEGTPIVLGTSPSTASFPATSGALLGLPPSHPPGDGSSSIKRSISDANSKIETARSVASSGAPGRTVLGVSGSKINRTRRQTTGVTPEALRGAITTKPPEISQAISYLYPETSQTYRPLNASLPVQHSTPRMDALVASSNKNAPAGNKSPAIPNYLQAPGGSSSGRPPTTTTTTSKNLRSVSCEYSGDSLSRGLSEASLASETASRSSYRDQIRFKEISTVFKECASILQSEIHLFGEKAKELVSNNENLSSQNNNTSNLLHPSVAQRGRLHSQQLSPNDVAPVSARSASRHSLYDNLDEILASGQRAIISGGGGKDHLLDPNYHAGKSVSECASRKQSMTVSATVDTDGLDDILAELQNSMDVLQKSIDGSVTIHDAHLRYIDDTPSTNTRQQYSPRIPPPAVPAPTTFKTTKTSQNVTPTTSVINVTMPLPALNTGSPTPTLSPMSVENVPPSSDATGKVQSSTKQQQQQQQQQPVANELPSRERHDSGVGSSITRSPNEQQRRHRVRWHSFQKSHVPGFCAQDRRHISCMSAGQLNMLRKVALLNLTAVVEKTLSPRDDIRGQTTADLLLDLNSWVKRPVSTKNSSAGLFDALRPGSPRVFGAPLSSVQQLTGQPLPLCILHAMRYVLHNCKDALGIFRRSGVRTRIQQLKEELESNPERTDFEGLSPYDVGDLIKQYFRELPTCLFTSQLSAVMLRSPPDRWLEVIENCLLLLPDENREVLHCLLLFLHDVAINADTHQMTASNLAICFAPSLFSLSAVLNADAMPSRSPNVTATHHRRGTKSNSSTRSNRTKSAATLPEIPDHRELMQQKTAHECLATMINNCQRIFTISEDTLRCCRFSYIDQSFPLSLTQITEQHGGFENYLNSLIHRVTKEVNENNRAWIPVDCSNMDSDCQLAYQRPADGHPLRLWRASTQVDAPPMELLKKIYHERHVWDPDVSDFRILQKLNMSTEIISYRIASMAPEPPREYVELRTWLKRNSSVSGLDQANAAQEECLVVATSIDHPGVTPLVPSNDSLDDSAITTTTARPRLASAGSHSIRGINLVTAFVIRPAGSGRSQVHMIARIDYRGRSAVWYNNEANFAAFCIASVRRLRESFRRLLRTNQPQNAPESVV